MTSAESVQNIEIDGCVHSNNTEDKSPCKMDTEQRVPQGKEPLLHEVRASCSSASPMLQDRAAPASLRGYTGPRKRHRMKEDPLDWINDENTNDPLPNTRERNHKKKRRTRMKQAVSSADLEKLFPTVIRSTGRLTVRVARTKLMSVETVAETGPVQKRESF